MTAEVIVLHPLRQTTAGLAWWQGRIPLAARIGTIESLAHDEHATDAAKARDLRQICHQSLTGLRLWLAWLAAEDAILIRDWTKPGDCDFKVYEERAEAAVSVLLHGNHGGDAA
jgi:hypothetical protein